MFRSADFKHSGMVTLCTTAMYCFSAFIERIRSNDIVRKGAWRDYVVLAAMTSTGGAGIAERAEDLVLSSQF